MEGQPEKKKKTCGLKKVVIAEVENDGSGKEGCPFHFGLRTYFQNIVPSQEKEVIETVDYLEESDFHYTSPSRKYCSWDKACIWCGVPLLIAGIIAILIGQLLPPKMPIVARRGSLAYFDRRAMLYNTKLEYCRLVGLGALCLAAIMILLSFLISAYSTPAQSYAPFLARPHNQGSIPLSGVITHVQPPSTQISPKR